MRTVSAGILPISCGYIDMLLLLLAAFFLLFYHSSISRIRQQSLERYRYLIICFVLATNDNPGAASPSVHTKTNAQPSAFRFTFRDFSGHLPAPQPALVRNRLRW